MPSEFPQLNFVHLHHIFSTDPNFSSGWFNQSIDVANQRGFTGSREAHHHLQTALGNFKVDVREAQDMLVFLQQFLLTYSFFDQR